MKFLDNAIEIGFGSILMAVGVAISAAVVSTVIDGRARRKEEMIATKLVKDISEGIKVDVPQKLIDAAVKEAVEDQVETSISKATKKVVDAVNNEISTGVKEGVNRELNNYNGQIIHEIETKCANLNVDAIKKTIEKRVAYTGIQKIESYMDTKMKEFDTDANRIYSLYKKFLANKAMGKSGDFWNRFDMFTAFM